MITNYGLTKIKLITILFFVIHIVETKEDKLVPYQAVKCPSILSFKYKLQAIVLDLDGKSEKGLMTCVMKNLNRDQSVLLFTGYHFKTTSILHKYKATENPNVIILTKFINPKVLLFPSVRRVLRSHRSMVYITIANSTLYNCKDGELNTKDFLTLQNFMNELWHKFKIMHAAVTFPVSCKEKIAVYNEKVYTNNTLYDRTIKLINTSNIEQLHATVGQSERILTEGYPLKADIFFRYPTAITDCDNLHYYTKMDLNVTKGYCGLDASVMYNIVKHFKFKLQYPKGNTCNTYGYAMPNNITGSLGCIVRQELDISFNSRFMMMYSEDDIYFVYYITTGSLCVLVKRASVVPVWHYPINVYEDKLWMLIIVLTVLIGIIMWAAATFINKISSRRREGVYYYIRDIFTSTMFGFSLVKDRNLYILRGTCLFCSIMFVAVIQGHINHMFTTLLRYETIKNLDDLYKSNTNLFVSHSMKIILKHIENAENLQQLNFFRRARATPPNYTLDFLVKNPNAALLGRKQDSILEILSEYMDENNSPLIHIVDECLYTYYLSHIARTGFPFYEELQRFMQRIGEAGLPIIYYRWTYNMLRVPPSLPKIRNEPRAFEKIKLQDQRVAFGILILGYIVSSVAFMIELLRGRLRRRKARKTLYPLKWTGTKSRVVSKL